MTKRLLPTIIIVAALASAVYTLTLIDQLVHVTLYSYKLEFSYDWANPYWMLLRITWALLAICAAATAVNAILIVRSGSSEKQRSVKIASTQEVGEAIRPISQTKERTRSTSVAPGLPPSLRPKPQPAPVKTSAPSEASLEAAPLFKCTNCGKTFAQPLRMLDFQVDPPRTVNVCPFCSETMPSAPKIKEPEQNKNRHFFKRNNNHVQKSLTQ